MTNVNFFTKKAQGMIWTYGHATANSLEECYDNPSNAKLNAERWCRADMKEHNGYDFRITGHNCMHFSCAYRYEENGIEYLVYRTHANTYRVAL